MNIKLTASNILILISIFFTFLAYFDHSILIEWSINKYFFDEKKYFHFIIQCFTGSFLHAGIFHLFMNSVFIYYFGNIVEIILGKIKYIIFFILFSLFNGIILLKISGNGYTIGISGFAVAILTYYTLELKKQKNPEYKGGITAIILSLIMGGFEGVSFGGHFNGVIFGLIFYFLNNNFLSRQFIGLFKYNKIQTTTPTIKAGAININKK